MKGSVGFATHLRIAQSLQKREARRAQKSRVDEVFISEVATVIGMPLDLEIFGCNAIWSRNIAATRIIPHDNIVKSFGGFCLESHFHNIGTLIIKKRRCMNPEAT